MPTTATPSGRFNRPSDTNVEFWNTAEGIEIKKRGPQFVDRLCAVFAERFANAYPYPNAPFLFRWAEVAKDLLAAEIPEAQPTPPSPPTEKEKFEALLAEAANDLNDPKVSTRDIREKVRSSSDYAKAHNIARQKQVAAGFHEELPAAADGSDAPSDVKRFAHLFKRSTITRQPSTGRVTLVVNRGDNFEILDGARQHTYHYSAGEFSVLEESAREWRLI